MPAELAFAAYGITAVLITAGIYHGTANAIDNSRRDTFYRIEQSVVNRTPDLRAKVTAQIYTRCHHSAMLMAEPAGGVLSHSVDTRTFTTEFSRCIAEQTGVKAQVDTIDSD